MIYAVRGDRIAVLDWLKRAFRAFQTAAKPG
jgi:hypothetical protein